eukprot:RCo027454
MLARALRGSRAGSLAARRAQHTLPELPVFRSAVASLDRTAVVHSGTSQQFSYRDLLSYVVTLKKQIEAYNLPPGSSVCFLVSPSMQYTATTLAVWACGMVAVPLCTTHPPAEMAYVLANSQARLAIAEPALLQKSLQLALQHHRKEVGGAEDAVPPVL